VGHALLFEKFDGRSQRLVLILTFECIRSRKLSCSALFCSGPGRSAAIRAGQLDVLAPGHHARVELDDITERQIFAF